MAKIDEKDKADIREMRKNGAKVKDIAAKYDISVQLVYLVTEDIKPKKEACVCKWCGTKLKDGYSCSNCRERVRLVRKIVALGQVIRKCVEEERMQRDGC